MDGNATAVDRYDGTDPDPDMRAYWIDTRRDTLVQVTDYTATSTTVTDHLVWGEALASVADIPDVVTGAGVDVAFDAAANTYTPSINTSFFAALLQQHVEHWALDTFPNLDIPGADKLSVFDWAKLGDTSDYDAVNPREQAPGVDGHRRRDHLPPWRWLMADGSGRIDQSAFLALTDTPDTYTADQWIKVNAPAGDALEFVAAPSGGMGATTLLQLTDTPNDYGHAGQYLHLNAAADALVWASIPSTYDWGAGRQSGHHPGLQAAADRSHAGRVPGRHGEPARRRGIRLGSGR